VKNGVALRTRDTGLNKFLRRLTSPEVTVGVHSSDGSAIEEGSALTVAEIAAIHEFGLGVPERSWLRAFVDENRDKLSDMLATTAKLIAEGKYPADVAMNRFGLAVVGMVKERITAGIEPGLAESTKLEKMRVTGGNAKDTPLIRFGQFVSAIAHEVNR
jgi:hypothetical protein